MKTKSKPGHTSATQTVPLKPTVELERLLRERFTPEGKAERVARSLAALREFEPFALPTEKLKFFAEDPDLEEQ